MSKIFKGCLMALAVAGCFIGQASAVVVPENDSGAEFFYVFGPEGLKSYGVDDHKMDVYIDVPEGMTQNVMISVYDADTGDKRDWRVSSDNPWDTVTQLTISGAKTLASKTFGQDQKADQSYMDFGPFKATDGQKVGSVYRFKLSMEGIKGDDANLFKVKVSPDSAAIFSYKVSVSLGSEKANAVHFYPSIPDGTKEVTVGNYGLGKNAGSLDLYDPATKSHYKVNEALAGEWSKTEIPLQAKHGMYFDYTLLKNAASVGNIGVKFVNEKKQLLPIYFSPVHFAPVTAKAEKAADASNKPKSLFGFLKGDKKSADEDTKKVKSSSKKEEKNTQELKSCNTFTFDGRSSYDVDKQNLTYAWDFGDGEMSSEPVITHTYAKGGTYEVSLMVTDTSGLQCDTADTKQSVYVNEAPVPSFKASDVICTAQTIKLNAGETVDNTPEKLSYLWDFGDGTKGNGVEVSKAYAKGGTYKIHLNVNDNDNTVCSEAGYDQTVKVNTPPTADAGSDQNVCLTTQEDPYSVNFDAVKSADADGDNLSYVWDFGDGETAEGQLITHVYKKGGDFIARVTVNDGSIATCNEASDTVKVSLNRSPVADAGEDKRVCIGNDLTFNGEKSHTEQGKLSYMWDFGDGVTAAGEAVTHNYVKGGVYNVTLKVDNGKATACSVAEDKTVIQANTPPTVKINDIAPSCVDSDIVFTADAKDADNDLLKYIWDFGDGTIVEGGAKITHKYAKGGDYKIALVVDDGKGFSCSKASITSLLHINTPPVANAGPNLACCVERETKFDGSESSDADGDTLKYLWSFGDGAVSDKIQAEHIYAKSGVFDVTLKVDDGSGTACSSSTSGFKATVNTKPVPVIKIK